ncbi:MAG: hypothetical protein ACOC35_16430, partial [Promethearchaeia archaeon]
FPAGQYLRVRLNVSDDTPSSSGIYYVRLYYSIEGETTGILPFAEDKWEFFTLVHMGEGLYSGILSAPDRVGFSAGQKVTFYIRVSDYAGNVLESNEITLEITEEMPLLSHTVLFGSLISFTGAMVYKIGFYRKKAKILDIEQVNKKHKKKTAKK